jgi:hypothetical protein
MIPETEKELYCFQMFPKVENFLITQQLSVLHKSGL